MKLRSLGKLEKVCSRSKSKNQQADTLYFVIQGKEQKLTQIRRRRNTITILGDEGVIRSTKINEPVPIPTLPQQNSRGMESVGHHGWPAVRDEVSLGDHPHVPDGREERVAGNVIPQVFTLLHGGLQIKVDDVAVGGVVEREEDSLEHVAIADSAGNEVGEARQPRRGRAEADGGRGGPELGLDEDRGVEGGQGAGGVGEEGGGEEGEGDEGKGGVRGGEGGEEEEEDKGDSGAHRQGSDPLPIHHYRRRPYVQGAEGHLHLQICNQAAALLSSTLILLQEDEKDVGFDLFLLPLRSARLRAAICTFVFNHKYVSMQILLLYVRADFVWIWAFN